MSYKEKKEEQILVPEVESEALALLPFASISREAPDIAVVQGLVPDAVSFLPERYEFVCVLGEGGMGSVFKVRDKNLNQIFALKMLRPQLMMDADALHRFNHEARAARELNHPNIATVYEYGFGKFGAPYLVMEHLTGKSLESILSEERNLSVPRAVGIAIQLAEALSYAHGEGLIHRDVKPSNIVINKTDKGEEIVKLVDFGIAKTVMNESSNFTRSGDVIGSPCYMSPEQCEGLRVGPQADLYSLGCVVYEMLSGKPPFVGSNSVQTVLKHLREEPMPLTRLLNDASLPSRLNEIVMHCLQKRVQARYQFADELKKDLESFAIDPNVPPSFKKANTNLSMNNQELKEWLIGDIKVKEFLRLLGVALTLGSIFGCFYLLCIWTSLSAQDDKIISASTKRNNIAVKRLLTASKKYVNLSSLDQQAQVSSVLKASGVVLNEQAIDFVTPHQ